VICTGLFARIRRSVFGACYRCQPERDRLMQQCRAESRQASSRRWYPRSVVASIRPSRCASVQSDRNRVGQDQRLIRRHVRCSSHWGARWHRTAGLFWSCFGTWPSHFVGSLLTHAGHHRRPNVKLRPGRIRIEPRPRELTVTWPTRFDRLMVSFAPIRMRLRKMRPMTCSLGGCGL
jgi:hypothetical protein